VRPLDQLGASSAESKVKCAPLERSPRSEMALIERQEASGVEPAREYDDGEVGQPDVKIGCFRSRPATTE